MPKRVKYRRPHRVYYGGHAKTPLKWPCQACLPPGVDGDNRQTATTLGT